MEQEGKKAAVIDIGSNTIKALAGRRTAAGLEVLMDRSVECRISEGMYAAPLRFTEEAMEKGVRAVEELMRAVGTVAPDEIEILATSAVRDAGNREDFCQRIAEKTGFFPKVLSGDEEAAAIANGVAQEPRLDQSRPYSITDLGGGSLEWILRHPYQVSFAGSMDLGAVRLLNRFVSDPRGALLDGDKEKIRAHCHEVFRQTLPPVRSDAAISHWGTGGAFTISRLILATENRLPLEKQDQKLPGTEIQRIEEILSPLPLPARQQYPGLPPSRADILPVALVIVLALAEFTGADAYSHSFCNLRMGRLATLLQNPL